MEKSRKNNWFLSYRDMFVTVYNFYKSLLCSHIPSWSQELAYITFPMFFFTLLSVERFSRLSHYSILLELPKYSYYLLDFFWIRNHLYKNERRILSCQKENSNIKYIVLLCCSTYLLRTRNSDLAPVNIGYNCCMLKPILYYYSPR